MRSVRAIDRKTVRVVLRSRLAAWHELFGPILPKHALRRRGPADRLARRDREPEDRRPRSGAVRSSPGRWQRGRQITLRRNPRYWGSHPAYVDRVILRFGMAGEGLVDGFQRGEVDVATGLPAELLRRARRTGRPPHARSRRNEHGALRVPYRPGRTPGAAEQARAQSPVLRRRSPGARACRAGRALSGDPRSATALSSPHRAATTGRTGARTATVRPRREGSSSSQVAGVATTGSTAARDSDSRCASSRRSFPEGFVRASSSSLRRSFVRSVSRSFPPTAPAPSSSIRSFLADRSTSPSSLGTSGRTRRRSPSSAAAAFQNYMGYCQRLVTADLDQAQRILDPRRQAHCAEPRGRADGEGRSGAAALRAAAVGGSGVASCGTSPRRRSIPS